MTGIRPIAIYCLAFLPAVNAGAAPEVAAFSQMTAGTAIRGWRALKPAPGANDTRYRLTIDSGTTVVKAEADNAMSGLIHPVRVDLRRYPLLRWRWKIEEPLEKADMTRKSGDDYAARVYVIFDYPREKLSFGTRAGLKLAEMLHGQQIPAAALNYVWDNRHPVGTIQPNAYTDRARMIVLHAGARRAGQWITETRDLAADFRAAFGEEAPDVIAIALATDTDNTGETATAWFGDFEFLPPAKAGAQ